MHDAVTVFFFVGNSHGTFHSKKKPKRHSSSDIIPIIIMAHESKKKIIN